jgi:hypothetical protein
MISKLLSAGARADERVCEPTYRVDWLFAEAQAIVHGECILFTFV